MKKHFFPFNKSLLGLFLLLMLFLPSCQKQIEPEVPDNRIINVSSDEKTGGNYLLVCFLGHDGSKCPGCVLRDGQLIHVNCQGAGSACATSSSVTLQQVGTAITATTTDTFGLTSLDFFNMPDRSLSTGESGNNAYLNIPAQLVERDTATLQFTFTGLFYTNKPEYNNF
jgi:hypothetical protein